VIRKLRRLLHGKRIGGFYTREVRSSGARQGFELVDFTGKTMMLAHVRFDGPHRVGKYGVNLHDFEKMLQSIFNPDDYAHLYLVDEIGRMECMSDAFVKTMRRLMDSGIPMVATIAERGHGFIAEAKGRQDAEIWQVTRENRDRLPMRARAWLGERSS